MRDIDIYRIFGVAPTTLHEWKKEKNRDDWRGKLYRFLKKLDAGEAREKLGDVEKPKSP